MSTFEALIYEIFFGMKKILFLIFVLTSCFEMISGQCLPEGITFNSQSEIDSFEVNYPGCAEIEGSVIINGTDITSLNGLNMITSIGGNL